MRSKNNRNKKLQITPEELERHNQKQKELEIAFSDENYYPYLEKVKLKLLKSKISERNY